MYGRIVAGADNRGGDQAIGPSGDAAWNSSVSSKQPCGLIAAAAVPPINTQSAQTSVLVKDGATTVIGGIYQGQETLAKQNTPFLAQIPILGLLFKNSSTQSTNNELLIFITPRIVR